jgi:hypothetical protein
VAETLVAEVSLVAAAAGLAASGPLRAVSSANRTSTTQDFMT